MFILIHYYFVKHGTRIQTATKHGLEKNQCNANSNTITDAVTDF